MGTASVADLHADELDGLLHIVSTMRDPTIVAGDFNAVRDSVLYGSLRGHRAISLAAPGAIT